MSHKLKAKAAVVTAAATLLTIVTALSAFADYAWDRAF